MWHGRTRTATTSLAQPEDRSAWRTAVVGTPYAVTMQDCMRLWSQQRSQGQQGVCVVQRFGHVGMAACCKTGTVEATA